MSDTGKKILKGGAKSVMLVVTHLFYLSISYLIALLGIALSGNWSGNFSLFFILLPMFFIYFPVFIFICLMGEDNKFLFWVWGTLAGGVGGSILWLGMEPDWVFGIFSEYTIYGGLISGVHQLITLIHQRAPRMEA